MASMLDRKAAETSNAFDILGDGLQSGGGAKRSKASKRRERKKENGTADAPEPTRKPKANKAKAAAVAAEEDTNIPQHTFNPEVISQAMAMGFTQSKVVEALERMQDHGYNTDDVNALLDRLTCTDDWHNTGKGATNGAAQGKADKKGKSKREPKSTPLAAPAAAIPEETNGGLHASLIPHGSSNPIEHATINGKPHAERAEKKAQRQQKQAAKKTKGGKVTAEQLGRDLIGSSRIADETGGDARALLWESWGSLLAGSETWESEEDDTRINFVDIFISSGALRTVVRSMILHPVTTEREMHSSDRILRATLDADETLHARLAAEISATSKRLVSANLETAAVVADAVADYFAYFQKATSRTVGLESELLELESEIEEKLAANEPPHTLLPLYERQKRILPQLLRHTDSPADIEEGYTSIVQRVDEHILSMGQQQDKLVQEQRGAIAQRQEIERSKLEQYKAATSTLVQLQNETGALLARKGELERELAQINEKIDANSQQLLNMQNLSPDDIHSSRISALVEDESRVTARLASQREDYEWLQHVRQFLTAAFSSLKERAEGRHTALRSILETGSDRYISSLRVSLSEQLQNAHVAKERLRLFQKKITHFEEEIVELEQCGTPGLATQLTSAVGQMRDAAAATARLLREMADESRARQAEVKEMMSFRGQQDGKAAALMATLTEIIDLAEDN